MPEPRLSLGLFEPFSRSFDRLDWIARLTSRVPDKGMQLTITEPEEDWIKARRKSVNSRAN